MTIHIYGWFNCFWYFPFWINVNAQKITYKSAILRKKREWQDGCAKSLDIKSELWEIKWVVKQKVVFFKIPLQKRTFILLCNVVRTKVCSCAVWTLNVKGEKAFHLVQEFLTCVIVLVNICDIKSPSCFFLKKLTFQNIQLIYTKFTAEIMSGIAPPTQLKHKGNAAVSG